MNFFKTMAAALLIAVVACTGCGGRNNTSTAGSHANIDAGKGAGEQDGASNSNLLSSRSKNTSESNLPAEEKEGRVTMTTTDSDMTIALRFIAYSTVTFDWGDGTVEEMQTSSMSQDTYYHTYTNKGSHTITITGKGIDLLNCSLSSLTALDVSNCTTLTVLHCHYNQLTSLDLSKNTALSTLHCSRNDFTADGLNALFGTLHSNDIKGNSIFVGMKSINITDNPGEDRCNRSIAEDKGWEINVNTF